MQEIIINKKVELVDTLESKIDDVKKYIFKLKDNLIMEMSYIDNNTNKDIICVPTQTMCVMACDFCHLTDHIGNIKTRNITSDELLEGIKHIRKNLDLDNSDKIFFISYMGAGEATIIPTNMLENIDEILKIDKKSKFGMATMLPKNSWMNLFEIAKTVKQKNIHLKIHLSLHYTNDKQRKKHMPNVLDIKPTLSALEFYNKLTNNPIEIHYTLIKGVNDYINLNLIFEEYVNSIMVYTDLWLTPVTGYDSCVVNGNKYYIAIGVGD